MNEHFIDYFCSGYPKIQSCNVKALCCAWIILPAAGVVVETIVFMAVYSLVIKKKYKK